MSLRDNDKRKSPSGNMFRNKLANPVAQKNYGRGIIASDYYCARDKLWKESFAS
jgi:hypothetical protein